MKTATFFSLIKSDIKSYKPQASFIRVIFWFFTDFKFHMLLLLRMGCFFRGKKIISVLCPIIKYLILIFFSSDMSFEAEYGTGIKFVHPIGIVIGRSAIIGNNCIIFQRVTLGAAGGGKVPEYPVLENNVVVYPNSVIAGKIIIGEGAVVAANSFVNKSVPAGTVVAGIPAKPIKKK